MSEPPSFSSHDPATDPGTGRGPGLAPGANLSALQALLHAMGRPVERLPVEHAILVALAAVVGVYAGLSAGLLANFIRLFQLVFFRTYAVGAAIFTHGSPWREAFRAQLVAANWHVELAGTAVALIVLSRVAERALRRRTSVLPMVGRVSTLGYAGAFGLALYYPLLVLASFNRTFGDTPGLFILLAQSSRLLWVAVPVLGGLSAGLLVRYVSPESGGHGVAEVLEAVAVPTARIPGRVAFWKSIASGLLIGSGGSAGREGPVVQMGAAVASYLARRLALRREDVALLLIAGGGAGIAASFNAPFAGMAFALEILLGNLGVRSLAPILLSAVTATLTGRTLIGAGGEIGAVTYTLKSPIELALYVMLGIVAGACAILYIRAVYGTEDLFEGHARGRLAGLSGRLARIPRHFRPMIGGLLVGVLGLLAPRALGIGYETMNAALIGQLGAGTLLLVLIVKILASGFTLGSGAPGGSFFPAVFMGAMLGGAFGVIGHRLAPGLIAGSGPYAAVGMGALVAGATLAPLTGIIMLFELTRSYSIVIPLMVSCGLATFIVQWWLGGSIYTLKLRKKGLHRLGERVEILTSLRVRDALAPAPPALAEATTLREIVRLFAEAATDAFAVVSKDGRIVGLLDWHDLRQAVSETALFDLAIAAELCLPAPSFSPDMRLDDALRTLVGSGRAHGLVLDGDRLVGLLSRRAILSAYDAASRPAEATQRRSGSQAVVSTLTRRPG